MINVEKFRGEALTSCMPVGLVGRIEAYRQIAWEKKIQVKI